MKPIALSAVALAAALGAAPAFAVQTVFTASLSGAAEAPPVTSGGLGFVIATLDDTAFTLRLQTIFQSLTGNVTNSHIHCCTAVPGSGTAGVATTLPTFAGFPAGGKSGTYDQTFDMTSAASWNPGYINANGGSTATAFAALSAGMFAGRSYLNIHTSFAPGGEIRGFLAPIPEPGTYAFMLSGLAAVGFMARRRQRA